MSGSKAVDPAYAGMNPMKELKQLVEEGGPRVCGDEPRPMGDFAGVKPWTPRMRG